MDPRLRPKSDLYIFGGYVLLGLAVLINPLSLQFWAAQGILPSIPAHHFHKSDLQYLLPAWLDLLWVTMGVIMVWAPKRLGYYLNDSFPFNLFLFVALLGLMFSLNVVQPGQYKLLRLLFLLGLLFVLLNTLYQAVVKKRDGQEVHPFYRNLSLAAFGVILVLMLFEGIFMFHEATHRFNGTLASRAWFLNHWELNAEGYRDAPYDAASVNGRKKVLVIGDSFVAGHGVADRKDRFTDRLEALIPGGAYRVYNLGVGGSDTRDENKRLRAFPYKPDVLVFSWYPNDIEQDGELGGLTLQHARSYHDIPGFARYFVRRSYLWNYIYWRFPHPDELSDYFGYIKQCFAYLKVRYAHLQEIDRLVAYGDSLQVPMAAVVFPFLENAEGSAFATDVIEARFRGHGVPTLSVRDMLKGKPALDYIVNQNDPHPNELLHQMVADSLYRLLQAGDAFTDHPRLHSPLIPPPTAPQKIAAPAPIPQNEAPKTSEKPVAKAPKPADKPVSKIPKAYEKPTSKPREGSDKPVSKAPKTSDKPVAKDLKTSDKPVAKDPKTSDKPVAKDPKPVVIEQKPTENPPRKDPVPSTKKPAAKPFDYGPVKLPPDGSPPKTDGNGG